MTTPTLSRITIETLANSRTLATQVVAAYGAGTQRLVRAVDGALQAQVMPRATKVAPRAGRRLDGLRGDVNRLVVRSIDRVVEVSEDWIAQSNRFATTQVDRWADRMAAIDNPWLTTGLQTAARLALPAAQLALVVTGKGAEGAAQLAERAGVRPLRHAGKAAVRKGTAAVRRATAKTTKIAKSTQAVKPAPSLEPALKAVRRRAAKAKTAAVAPLARARRTTPTAVKSASKTAAKAKSAATA